ncbi:MAG: proton-conducting transporter membrane subunit, partial [Pseudomonadota bacterium]
MTALWLMLFIPLTGVVLLAFIGHHRHAGWVNIILSALSLATSLWLAAHVLANGPLLSPSRMMYIDAFNVYLVTLTALVGLTTAIFSRPYMQHEVEARKIGKRRMRMYHSMYQAFMFAMQAALTTNNIGILWVAMEGATLTTVLLVSLYRTPEAVAAAGKYFILCGVGIAQALFGTVLLYFAAARVIPSADDALLWNVLYSAATQLDPTVLTLAFVFLLVGYGTKVGLVPLHNWLPDAHSEGPTPMSA